MPGTDPEEKTVERKRTFLSKALLMDIKLCILPLTMDRNKKDVKFNVISAKTVITSLILFGLPLFLGAGYLYLDDVEVFKKVIPKLSTTDKVSLGIYMTANSLIMPSFALMLANALHFNPEIVYDPGLKWPRAMNQLIFCMALGSVFFFCLPSWSLLNLMEP